MNHQNFYNLYYFKKLNEKLHNLSDYQWSYGILFLSLIFVEFFRRPDSLLNAQPWAEDGIIFLEQAIQNSTGSIFIPYAGYYNTIPRIATLIALQFGLPQSPLIMNLFALIISVFCIFYVFNPNFRFIIPNDFHRSLLAFFIVCLPISEIWLNITNIQWFIIFYLTLWVSNVIFNPEIPKISLYTSFEMIFTVIAFLSCPLSFILIPGLFIGLFLKIWNKKIEFNLILYLFPFLSILSYFFICFIQNTSSHLQIPSIISIINMMSSQIFFRLFYNINNYEYSYAYIFASLIITILYYSAIKRHEFFIDGWFISLFILSIFMIVISRPQFVEIFSSTFTFVGARYFFYPMMLLLILFFRHISTFRLSIIKYIFYIALFIILWNCVINYELSPFQDYHYQSAVNGVDFNGNMEYSIPINPPGWFMRLPTNSDYIKINVNNGKIIFNKSMYVFVFS